MRTALQEIMLSIEKCKEILTSGGQQYSNDEAKEIREFLYHLKTLHFDSIKKQREKSNTIR